MKLIINNISDILHLLENGVFDLLNEIGGLCCITDMIVDDYYILKNERDVIDERA